MEQKALKCMEINQTLLYKQLPAHMIVTNFIAGEDDCNYEIYIREFINESSYFWLYQMVRGMKLLKVNQIRNQMPLVIGINWILS